jgi:hypothetical protein
VPAQDLHSQETSDPRSEEIRYDATWEVAHRIAIINLDINSGTFEYSSGADLQYP